jgi:hypothetical protein
MLQSTIDDLSSLSHSIAHGLYMLPFMAAFVYWHQDLSAKLYSWGIVY